MAISIQQAIQAMVVAAQTRPDGDDRRPERPVITISRDEGSGGDAIARLLAERLNVPLYDQQILNEIAEQLDTDRAALTQLDESLDKGRLMWLYRLVTGEDVSLSSYRRTLVRVILSLGRVGGVLVGRGAHIVLANHVVLRVRICGSAKVCAARLASETGLAEADALQRIKDINHNRGKFIWEMFGTRLNDPCQFDITLNTDRLNGFDAAVDMLVDLAQRVHQGEVMRDAVLAA